MADYSEFPTTPTAWQEAALRDAGWHEVAPLPPEDPQPRRGGVDKVALAAGIVFVLFATAMMSGVSVSSDVFRDGGVLWAVLIGLGVLLLTGEVRRARRR